MGSDPGRRVGVYLVALVGVDVGVQYHMTPPPGTQPFIALGTDGFRYKIPETEKEINNLYEKVTQPTRATVPAPTKVM